MFVRVHSRRRPTVPWATAAVAAACVVAFLALGTFTDTERSAMLSTWGVVPDVLLGPAWAAGDPLAARPATLLTSLLLHADWLHLSGNVLFLLILGFAAERALGPLRFLGLFLACGAIANVAGAWVLSGGSAPIVGASGAVSAIVGAWLALFPRANLGLVLPLGLDLEFVRVPAPLLIGFWVLLQVAFSLVDPAFGKVAWSVHLAGFALGAAFALVSRPALARRQRG
ncbi:MAG: rhomboid family intramembrane serine protease [Pseudomonadota bacterium]